MRRFLFLKTGLVASVLVLSAGNAKAGSSVLLRCDGSTPGPGENCVTHNLAQVEFDPTTSSEVLVIQAFAQSIHQHCHFGECYDPGDCKAPPMLNFESSVKSEGRSFVGDQASALWQADDGYHVTISSGAFSYTYDKGSCGTNQP